MNWKTIFNPFERFDEKHLLLTGILAVILSIATGYWTNTAFTSIYRISNVENASFKIIATTTLLSFLAAIVVLFILGKILNSKTRIIDIVNTVLISQLALILFQCIGKISYIKLAGKNVIKYESDPSGTFPFLDFLIMISMTLISIITLIYSITLFYNGFKTATNIKKWQHIVLFCVVSLVSTLVCQVIINKII
ncbi:YIP1 family protein [Chryseobacterium jejuense]|uniref:YIP1 family protein n=1 Tax=Chryseobacterium jejuense TaxID=445960 RepID=UPI001AE2BAD4|nr:YIP1 family protein [Chryseobacterium jejuense]MBP2615879.1 putative membrane protein [Chryseobacterium jejuense]